MDSHNDITRQSDKDANIAQRIKRVHEEESEAICVRLERKFPGLSPEDVADVWQETLVTLWILLDAGKVNTDQPLTPLVWTIAKFHALNRVRRNKRRRLIEGVHVDDDVLPDYDFVPLTALLIDVAQFIDRRLADRQRIVFWCYVKLVCWGYASDKGKLPKGMLYEEVTRTSPIKMSKASVRSAFRRGRRQVKAFLKAKGYYRWKKT
jgi:DNA-directed RNA polymerase specialized sigma24 family protein